MKKRCISAAILILGAAAGAHAQVVADTDARYEALKALGELNGTALQCKYLDQTRRMKAAVVESVPKERSFGLAFDQATNDAFVAMVQSGTPCPGILGFEVWVGERIEVMQEVFRAP